MENEPILNWIATKKMSAILEQTAQIEWLNERIDRLSVLFALVFAYILFNEFRNLLRSKKRKTIY